MEGPILTIGPILTQIIFSRQTRYTPNETHRAARDPPTLIVEEEGRTLPLSICIPSPVSNATSLVTETWATPGSCAAGRTSTDTSCASLFYFTASEPDTPSLGGGASHEGSRLSLGSGTSFYENEARIMQAILREEGAEPDSFWEELESTSALEKLMALHLSNSFERQREEDAYVQRELQEYIRKHPETEAFIMNGAEVEKTRKSLLSFFVTRQTLMRMFGTNNHTSRREKHNSRIAEHKLHPLDHENSSGKAMQQAALIRRCFLPRRDVIKWMWP